jgi:branched-chain amino acid transport system substrate-binding protein
MPQRFRIVLAMALYLALPSAWSQVKVGVMVSSTGPTSAIGIPQKNTAALLPARMGNLDVEYIVLDDGGDPAVAVRNAKKLMSENGVDAIIGPSTTPNAMAMIDFVAEAQTPLLATVGSSNVIEPMDAKKRWVFKTTQNDDLIADALIEHMTKSGVKSVGFIALNDAYGENWYRVFGSLAQKAGIHIVANERYARADSSVTGQTLKLIAAKPDAVLVAGVGATGVLPQATLYDQGYRGRVYQTHGVATDDFIRLGGAKVEGTVLAAGPMLVIDEIADGNPVKKVSLDYINAYQKLYGSRPATFGANTFDAGILLARAAPVAARKAKPGNTEFRSALRDALEQEKEVVGCQGVFNMSPANHNGMDARARVLVTVKAGRFRLLGE